MKVLLSWLREFAPIEGDPVELGNQMSDLGMAVEEMTIIDLIDGIVVAEVVGLRPHPKADRIQIVDVDPGDGVPLQVCCGAFNMAVGDKIPFATIGTTMPDGMEISQRKMRGEFSNGMCCSASEIGLGSDHEGILILSPELVVGEPVMAQLGAQADVLWDLEINPNRPDAMSIAGVARDLAARLNIPFQIPKWSVDHLATSEISETSVSVTDSELCPRFTARVLEGVSVGVSPLWMQTRLQLLGMRSINSVVDVSNYVMLELGTPNHTYDLSLVDGNAIGVRRAKTGESIKTLDGQERFLAPGDGVIVDGSDVAIGVAGVMGGSSTEISDSTNTILLELACWDRTAIARTSQRMGLRSEASSRFERGTDINLSVTAVERFCYLLNEITPGGIQTEEKISDVQVAKEKQTTISVRTSRINLLLGQKFSGEDVANLLIPIGFEVVQTDDADVQLVTIPSFRPDSETETDIAEEVGRHFGYGRLGATVPRSPNAGHLTFHQKARRLIRQVMVGAGLDEAMPSPFLAPDAVANTGLSSANVVHLLNPLAIEESVLRPSLRSGLLTALAYNQSHRNENVKLFEIGSVFAPSSAGSGLPDEHEMLGVILGDNDALAAKQLWDVIAAGLGINGELRNAIDLPGLHPRRAGQLIVDDQEVGVVGELDPRVLENYGVSNRCGWLELRLDLLIQSMSQNSTRLYGLVSTYPSSDLDLAFVVKDEIQASDVERTIRSLVGSELASLELFDVFRGEKLGEGKRSLAFSLRLQSAERTLTHDQLASIQERCIEAVETTHDARLR